MAYTSPSTALNQKESEKANDSAPTTPALRMSSVWAVVGSGSGVVSAAKSARRSTSLLARRVIIQNKNSTAKAELRPESALMSGATFVTSPNENSDTSRPSSKNVGAPGGCGTSSL